MNQMPAINLLETSVPTEMETSIPMEIEANEIPEEAPKMRKSSLRKISKLRNSIRLLFSPSNKRKSLRYSLR